MSKKAIVTGASRGIGKGIAMCLAAEGYDLAISYASKKEEAEKVAEQIRETYHTRCLIYQAALQEKGAGKALFDRAVADLGGLDLLVNNAGFGVFGEFTETDLQQELELLQVNIRALHILTKLFLRDFQKRGSGRILNVASSAGFLTGPLLSSYYASKNYVVRLSLAIAEELRHQHSRVTISLLCPGPVDTKFNDRAGVRFRVKAMSAEDVAKEAVFGVLTGKLIIIPGMLNQLGIFASRFVPQQLMSRITYYIQAAKRN